VDSKTHETLRARLATAHAETARRYPGESGDRQPVHTVYGGAQIFSATTATKLGQIAEGAFAAYAPTVEEFAEAFDIDDRELAELAYRRVAEKLKREPVEDFRIDFEDGYGNRPDDEEDADATRAAREAASGLAQKTLPPFLGIRIKPFTRDLVGRSLRTLDLFIAELLAATGGVLPSNFVVTLPKIATEDEVEVLASALERIEVECGLERGAIAVELMVETPQSIFGPDGTAALPRLVAAGAGRVRGVHFGTYDYTASLAITAAFQDMAHPVCDFAKQVMQVTMSGTGVWLSDGATNVLPVTPHRGEKLTATERSENRESVHRAWRLHAAHTRHSLEGGFYQGWDLHPAQLVSRYATVYSFFLAGIDSAAERLSNFVDRAAQATLVGDVFDDAATGQGLLNYFLRAINCGALSVEEAQGRSGLTLEELQSRSFLRILAGRRG
jgi:citrate lyase beta subunit